MLPLTASLSAIQSYRRCRQQYSYRYVARLRRRDKLAAPTLGDVLHKYLGWYYSALKDLPISARQAHGLALEHLDRHVLPNVRGYVTAALTAGDEETARELAAIPDAAVRIAKRYFEARGREDAIRHRVLAVEHHVSCRLWRRGIPSIGVVDMLTKDRETGRVLLWEHKSTKHIPDTSLRLRDLQTLLYSSMLVAQGAQRPDAICWNYLRTKEPTIPERLARGELTRRSNLDSTWETYRAELARNGLREADYEDVKERLLGREYSVYFPRVEQVAVAGDGVLLADYVADAKRMAYDVRRWRAGREQPTRSVARDCDFCEYYPLCEAAIMGGDTEDIIRLRYTVSEEKEGRNDDRSATATSRAV